MTEAITTRHPDYTDRVDEWALMRAARRGEVSVKDAGTTYLPMPSGFSAQPDAGAALYAAYQKRAQFPEIVDPAIQAMVGVIHQTEIKIEMPDGMSAIWESATKDGLPLEAFHRRVTSQILTTGRYGILADAAEDGEPHLVGYDAESLINWADDRSMFVLDESGLVRDGFRWEQQQQYLALLIEDGKYIGQRYDGAGIELTQEGVAPTTASRQTLSEIPFVVIGPRDLSLAPETPPLIGIARSAIAMYQLSADYRWQLFMTGQETLFVINGDAPDAVGAGVVVQLKGGSDGNPPDAKYVGPAGTGIEKHRQAIQDEKQNAANAGARLFNSESSNAQESGYARQIRYAAETASLTSIAQASCAGLEKALRYVALMKGIDPTQVVVTPPKSFVESEMTPEEMKAIMGLWENSLISYQTAYENLQAGRVASAERTWEDELTLIDKEDVARSPSQEELAAIAPPVDQPAA